MHQWAFKHKHSRSRKLRRWAAPYRRASAQLKGPRGLWGRPKADGSRVVLRIRETPSFSYCGEDGSLMGEWLMLTRRAWDGIPSMRRYSKKQNSTLRTFRVAILGLGATSWTSMPSCPRQRGSRGWFGRIEEKAPKPMRSFGPENSSDQHTLLSPLYRPSVDLVCLCGSSSGTLLQWWVWPSLSALLCLALPSARARSLIRVEKDRVSLF